MGNRPDEQSPAQTRRARCSSSGCRYVVSLLDQESSAMPLCLYHRAKGPDVPPAVQRVVSADEAACASAPEQPASYGPAAEAVLSLALELLGSEAGRGQAPFVAGSVPAYHGNDHGTIAGAFLTRFVLRGLGGDVERDIRAASDEIRRALHTGEIWPNRWDAANVALLRRGLKLRPELSDELLEPSSTATAIPAKALALMDVCGKAHRAGIRIRVWSALVSDKLLGELIERTAEKWAEFASQQASARGRGLAPTRPTAETCLHGVFIEHGGRAALPYIRVDVAGDTPPPPGSFVEWYRRGPWARWQNMLWDGRSGLKRRRRSQRETLIRGWTFYSLEVHARLGLRDAMRAWNGCVAPALHLEPGGGALMGRENQAAEERDRAKQVSKRVGTYLHLDFQS